MTLPVNSASVKYHHKIALIGNPNSGKSTLFNRLTGAQQTTGNWPGVTVEKKTGFSHIGDQRYEIIDLPGVYSLETASRSGLDEKIARDFLSCQPPQLVINVVDVTNLERQLFLTAQLLHMGLPVVVVLNRMDLLTEHNLRIDLDALANKLGCAVIPISAYYNQGIDELKEGLAGLLNQRASLHFDLPDTLHRAVHRLRDLQPMSNDSCWRTLQMLINPSVAPLELRALAQAEKSKLEAHYEEDLALIAADLYFQFAHDASHLAVQRTDKFSRNLTDQIDRWVLHPLWGLPIFFVVMYLVFAFSINLGNAFLDFFDQTAQAIFVDGFALLLQNLHAPEWLITLLANGVGGGIQVVASFIPVIGALFLLLSLLEESGYMQRAALNMDRFMRRIGLSGQAFIPLVVGFGCNIPAVAATRILPDERDRIMTVMMTPFMSCSARLTVYVLFASAFFVEYASLLVFSLYVIGILAAILTAFILKKTLLPGDAPPLLLELPNYHKPALINILHNTRHRLHSFIVNAGKVIVLVVLLISFFNSLGRDGSFGHENQNDSVLSLAAQQITPLFSPLGVSEENWPATVGLVTGILAKEVVVGSLDALYQGMTSTTAPNPPRLDDNAPAAEFDLVQALSDALATIPHNLSGMLGGLIDPLGLASITSSADAEQAAQNLDISTATLTKMAAYFGSPIAAYAYLLLILLYFPCVATLGAIKAELGRRWALYSAGWSVFLGYTVAVGFYQAFNWTHHPVSASLWLSGIALSYLAVYLWLKRLGAQQNTASRKA
jgi:ferrous iron transport protein B